MPQLAGHVFQDAETAVLMREHGIRRICTRDTDFHRVPFLEPIDPLRAEPSQSVVEIQHRTPLEYQK